MDLLVPDTTPCSSKGHSVQPFLVFAVCVESRLVLAVKPFPARVLVALAGAELRSANRPRTCAVSTSEHLYANEAAQVAQSQAD
jgi:hypothetical protein